MSVTRVVQQIFRCAEREMEIEVCAIRHRKNQLVVLEKELLIEIKVDIPGHYSVLLSE